jgi:P27 family predicted phage terminase small subunit
MPKNEAEIPSEIPDPPDHLSKKAKAEWERIAPELERYGLLTKIDDSALAAYCDYFAQWAEASAKIKKQGMIIQTGFGPQVNPWLRISNKAVEGMNKILVEFGMTPSSRSRVKAAPKPEEKPKGTDYFEWVEGKGA